MSLFAVTFTFFIEGGRKSEVSWIMKIRATGYTFEKVTNAGGVLHFRSKDVTVGERGDVFLVSSHFVRLCFTESTGYNF